MKNLKTFLCGTLACAMLFLTACGNPATSGGSSGATPTTTEKGAYVETDITPPSLAGQQVHLYQAADDQLVVFSEDYTKRFDSADDGDTWQETPGPGATAPELASARQSAYLPDENAILAAITDEATGKMKLVKYALDGTATPFPMAEIDEAVSDGKTVHINQLIGLPDNKLFISFYGFSDMGSTQPDSSSEIDGSNSSSEESASEGGEGGQMFNGPDDMIDGCYLYDTAQNKTITNLADYLMATPQVSGNTLYLLDSYNKTLTGINAADGSKVEGLPALPNEMPETYTLSVGPNGVISLLNNKGIETLTTDGLIEVLKRDSYSIGNPANYALSMLNTKDKTYIINLMQGTSSTIYKYHWDENATIDPEKVLTVWALEDNLTVRAAIAEFKKKNPDATILMEIASGGEGGVSQDDAIKNLNTRLIAGDAPDILILDGTPMESYSKKGMLANLSGLIDTSDFFDGITKAFAENDTVYSLPARIYLPLLIGNTQLLSNITNIETLVSAIKNGNDAAEIDFDSNSLELPESERSAFNFENWNELYKLLSSTSISEIIKDNSLNTDQLKVFLNALKDITTKYNLTIPKDNEEMASVGMIVGSSGGNSSLAVPQSVMYQNMGRSLAGAMISTDLLLTEMLAGDPGNVVKPLPGLAENAWMPTTIAAINADSAKQELAANFLQTLYSTPVQGSTTMGTGFPISKSGLNALTENILKEQEKMPMTEKINIDFSALLNKLGTPVFSNQIIADKMQDAAYEYSIGQLDLEGAVSQIEQNIRNLLAERS